MIENNSKLACEVNIIRKNEITLKALILLRGSARPDVSPNFGLKLAEKSFYICSADIPSRVSTPIKLLLFSIHRLERYTTTKLLVRT